MSESPEPQHPSAHEAQREKKKRFEKLRKRLPGAKRRANPTADMALVDHLRELRRRMIISVLAFLAAAIVGFIWYQHAPSGMTTLGEIMRQPYCQLPAEMRADFSHDGECRLLATGPFEMFMLRLKVAAIAGLVISSPIWLYQIWAFIVPGLHRKEKRWAFAFVSIAVALFLFGSILAYFVVTFGLEFLVGIGGDNQFAAFTGLKYFNFVLALMVIFGISFELPLILVTLNIFDLFHYESINGRRHIVWIIVFIFSAFMTPGGDPFSMVIMAISVNLLLEGAFQFCRINDKRRGYDKMSEWNELDDEEASELDYQPAILGEAGEISAPEPIERPQPIRGTSEYFDDVL